MPVGQALEGFHGEARSQLIQLPEGAAEKGWEAQAEHRADIAIPG